MAKEADDLENLGPVASEYIEAIIRKMRYRRKVREEVKAELEGHFADALKDCRTDEERQAKAQELIDEFGDVKLLATLIRRGKKRCRPLWKKVVIHSLQVAGILIVCMVLRGIQLSVGTPDITVDYVAWLTELSSDGRDESQNAKPYFDRAVELSKEMPEDMRDFLVKPAEQMSEEQREAIAKFLEEDAESLDMVRAGVRKPYYWTDYEKSAPSEAATKAFKGLLATTQMIHELTTGISPSLNGYKELSRKLAFGKIALKIYNGDAEGALDDCLILERFGSHLLGKGLLIEQLVGIAIEAIALDRTFRVLDKLDVDGETLRRVQEKLAKIYAKQELIINLDGEKVFWYDSIQQTFTDDGRGNGRMLIRGLPLVVGDWKKAVSGFVLGYPDRKEVMSKIDRYFESAANLSVIAPWELRGKASAGDKQNWAEIGTESLLLSLVGPAYGRVGELSWRQRQGRVALITVLGVLRYKKDRGRYPTELDEVVEGGYISQLPRDFYSDGPMQYKITDDGFMLYSVGFNFEDDGGVMEEDSDGRKRKWSKNGDFVFWPID
jgi:dsDNA-binding SOS-regulon protein